MPISIVITVIKQFLSAVDGVSNLRQPNCKYARSTAPQLAIFRPLGCTVVTQISDGGQAALPLLLQLASPGRLAVSVYGRLK